ncbi:MAG: 3-oxoacyl-[acyl-carrier protein] reductase, partial [uncultured Pseudonocardia sp.]
GSRTGWEEGAGHRRHEGRGEGDRAGTGPPGRGRRHLLPTGERRVGLARARVEGDRRQARGGVRGPGRPRADRQPHRGLPAPLRRAGRGGQQRRDHQPRPLRAALARRVAADRRHQCHGGAPGHPALAPDAGTGFLGDQHQLEVDRRGHPPAGPLHDHQGGAARPDHLTGTGVRRPGHPLQRPVARRDRHGGARLPARGSAGGVGQALHRQDLTRQAGHPRRGRRRGVVAVQRPGRVRDRRRDPGRRRHRL